MTKKIIYGIQQIGVGVDDASALFKWYATRLGADVPLFDDNNVATHMAPYMGGMPHEKRAILALNMQGGSAYEIWQFLDRKPQAIKTHIQMGDLGICVAKIKSKDIHKSYARLQKQGVQILSEINIGADGCKSFYIQDPCENMLQIKESSGWFAGRKFDMGGVFGATIGVSNIEKSLKLYANVLGYRKVVYDETGVFVDLRDLPNGEGRFRRVLIEPETYNSGGFSRLFGPSQLELIQSVDDYTPQKIYEGRYWGDIGFIHLCFDMRHMDDLVNECAVAGFPFKVLSEASFDMGDTNGHWGYIEDADGTLIEFVETRKVPVLKKLNIAIDLTKRDPNKALPNWLVRALSLKRVKFKE